MHNLRLNLIYLSFFCSVYKPQICRKLAARLRLIFAARLPQTRFSYANYFSGALFRHTMCAASMQRTVVAHCSGTQCAPQVCSALLSHTILVCLNFAAHSCRALRCSAPYHPPPPPHTPPPWFITPTAIFFFSSLPPGGV